MSSINFLGKHDFEWMKHHHDNYMYPPGVNLKVILKDHNPADGIVFRLGFQGCTCDSDLEADIVLISGWNMLCIKASSQYDAKQCVALHRLCIDACRNAT